MEAITRPALDGWLEDLKRNLSAWENTGLEKRLSYLRQLRKDCHRLAPRWAEVCCQIKGVDPKSQLAGEEWAIGPMILLRNLRLMEKQLQTPLREGSRVVRSLPGDNWDFLQWPILRGETWSEPTYVPALPVRGKVGLVLGAGNVSSISATDVIYKMFIEDQVVLLKMNPVHDLLGPVLEEVFQCLIQDGFLRIVSGGATEGSLACSHPKVEALHVTGSHHTYAAIRRVAPDRPITAELGCVSPVIVAPGRWSARQLSYQARHVAGMLTTNAGFNCNAAQVLVTSRQWPQREAFLTEVRRALSKVPARPAYYPGALERHATIIQANPQAEQLGPPAPGAVCWTLIPGLDPEEDHPGFQQEAFCGALYEVALDVPYTEFLLRAADFVNEKLWGNLSCSILISPEGQRTQPWRRALENLRYGAVGVNIWPGLIFALVNLPWGAYPGNTPEDIQSGVGSVHNTANVGSVQKAVLYAPFYTPIRMPWQSGFARFLGLARALTDFEYQPSLKNVLKAHWQALRGGLGM
jgi:hypothetical protein